ncbi:MAG: Uncharacterized protein G01um10145_800, partial [Microgenomates group bacterium Gr01-1014_5]
LKRIIKSMWTAAGTMALSAIPAFAQKEIDLKPTGQFTELGKLEFADIVSKLIRFALIIAAVVFFFMLLIGGIKWIMSGGDKGKTEEARNQITAALVGLVIVFSAWAIAQLTKALFGIDILNLKFS